MAVKTYDIKADFSAVGDGHLEASIALSITNGGFDLTAGTSVWTPSDVGKSIGFFTSDNDPFIPSLFIPFLSTIASYVNGTHITLANAFSQTTMSSYTTQCEWGTDDAPAFNAFNIAAVAWQAGHPTDTFELTIPAGTYELVTNPAGTDYFTRGGLKEVTVTGASKATTVLSDCIGGVGCTLACIGSTYGLNNPGIGQFPGSRIATVAARSTSVRLLTPSETAWFNIGDVALLGGLDLQGYGYPPNQQWQEYPTIQSIDGGTGVITFTAPIEFEYKSTWPLYNPGADHPVPDASDCGGPASLFPLVPNFQCKVVHQGYTLSQWNKQTFANGKDITLNINARGPLGIFLSGQGRCTMDSDQTSALMELDKIIGSCNYSGTINGIEFQSTATNHMTISNATFLTTCTGTPDNLVATNTTFANLRLGCFAYGSTSSVILDNVVISSLEEGGTLDKGGPSQIGVQNFYTMVGSTIISPAGPIPWAVPGRRCFWAGYRPFGAFNIIDVYRNGSNTNIVTDWPYGMPSNANWVDGSGRFWIWMHVCPSLTVRNSGALFRGHPDGWPYASYWNSGTLDKTTIGAETNIQSTGQLWGSLISYSVDVQVPYLGGLNSSFKFPAVFQNYPAARLDSASTLYTYGPIFNLAIAGKRIITPSGVTGQQSGDSGLDTGGPIWFTGGSGFGTHDDLSGESTGLQVVIEVFLDQGFNEGTETVTIPHTFSSFYEVPVRKFRQLG